jgi:hypothetical protein
MVKNMVLHDSLVKKVLNIKHTKELSSIDLLVVSFEEDGEVQEYEAIGITISIPDKE